MLRIISRVRALREEGLLRWSMPRLEAREGRNWVVKWWAIGIGGCGLYGIGVAAAPGGKDWRGRMSNQVIECDAKHLPIDCCRWV